MSVTEIIVRTAEQDDAVLVANAISNGLTAVGFDNVLTDIIGATDHSDPELVAAIGRVNPELLTTPVEITFERNNPLVTDDEPTSFETDPDDDVIEAD